MTTPRDEYRDRLARSDREIARHERNDQRLAQLRLAMLGVAVAMFIGAVQGAVGYRWLFAPAVVFLLLVVVHDRVLKARDRSRRLRAIYEDGLARLDGKWTGRAYVQAAVTTADPTARDLDLFGRASLFQLLNTARTEVGSDTLAGWLTRGADAGEIDARQRAVAELRDTLEFRERLAVTAIDVPVARTRDVAAWAAAAPRHSPATRNSFLALAAVSAVLTTMTVAGVAPISILSGWLLLQFAIAFLWSRGALNTLAGMDKAAKDLELLSRLLAQVEGRRFEAARLTALQRALPADGRSASGAIARLQRFVQLLDSCRNQIFLPVAVLFQVPSLLMIAIDQWRRAHGAAVAHWLRVIGEFEALAALATFAYEHPADPFPDIAGDGPVFDAIGLAHPLLNESVAVRNDVRLGGPGPRLLVISGSNMSGKSTLLRAIGVNVVLALAGAPVRASRLRVSPLAVGSTVRVEDSLQDGQSRFFAEIVRLRAIVELARGPVPTLFLLDEILAGTNSLDRRVGAEGIIRALLDLGAVGCVTTHDLALTALVPALGAAAANVHFQDRIDQGRMIFDYTMRPGVVEHSNALDLMKTVGLDV